MKYILIILFLSHPLSAQDSEDLFKTLQKQDSLIFEIGFNQCNTQVFDELVAADFKFYHDQSGITPDKESFIIGIRDGLCAMNYKAIRELDESSLRVFPLYDNGRIYGALQTGSHRFYAISEGSPRTLTSTALFNHLWILMDGTWKLKEVISYDHVPHNE